MFGLGPWEVGVIALVVATVFGVGRLPEIGGVFGKALVNFKREMREAKKIDLGHYDGEIDKKALSGSD